MSRQGKFPHGNKQEEDATLISPLAAVSRPVLRDDVTSCPAEEVIPRREVTPLRQGVPGTGCSGYRGGERPQGKGGGYGKLLEELRKLLPVELRKLQLHGRKLP